MFLPVVGFTYGFEYYDKSYVNAFTDVVDPRYLLHASRVNVQITRQSAYEYKFLLTLTRTQPAESNPLMQEDDPFLIPYGGLPVLFTPINDREFQNAVVGYIFGFARKELRFSSYDSAPNTSTVNGQRYNHVIEIEGVDLVPYRQIHYPLFVDYKYLSPWRG